MRIKRLNINWKMFFFCYIILLDSVTNVAIEQNNEMMHVLHIVSSALDVNSIVCNHLSIGFCVHDLSVFLLHFVQNAIQTSPKELSSIKTRLFFEFNPMHFTRNTFIPVEFWAIIRSDRMFA